MDSSSIVVGQSAQTAPSQLPAEALSLPLNAGAVHMGTLRQHNAAIQTLENPNNLPAKVVP
jgi:hypothetical protein